MIDTVSPERTESHPTLPKTHVPSSRCREREDMERVLMSGDLYCVRRSRR